MIFAFDHFYTTTFEQGSNLGDTGLKLVNTYVKDVKMILLDILLKKEKL